MPIPTFPPFGWSKTYEAVLVPFEVPSKVKSPPEESEPYTVVLSPVKTRLSMPPQSTSVLVVMVASEDAVRVEVPERVVVVLVRVVVAPKVILVASPESVISLPRTRKSPFTSSF